MTHIEKIQRWETKLENTNLTEKQAEKLEAQIHRAFDKIRKSQNLQNQYEEFYGIEWLG